MNRDDGPLGLYCPACEEPFGLDDVRVVCPNCDGPLRVTIDTAERVAPEDLTGATGIERYTPLVGESLEASPSLGAFGSTPVECPSLASDVGSLWIADEGRNPTGSAVDREMAIALGVPVDRDADRVVLPSTGHGAQSAAAYAGRAGLDSLSFVPSRTPFLNKAMANVHGGDLSVVEGRYHDAREAYAQSDAGGFPVDPRSPFRRIGVLTLAWDVLAGLDWTAPDAIVLPVGHGHRIAGLATGLRAAVDAGLVESMPRLYAAQPDGCAPIVTAHESGAPIDPVATPDSVVGTLEIPAPSLGSFALDAIGDSDGGAVAVSDDAALAAAVDANATAGVEVSATGGVALAGASQLSERGALAADALVIVVDPLAVAAESDVLRSHLMSRGI